MKSSSLLCVIFLALLSSPIAVLAEDQEKTTYLRRSAVHEVSAVDAGIVGDGHDDEEADDADIVDEERRAEMDMTENRIINGYLSKPSQFPFYVQGNGCGAVLIARDMVLTAGKLHHLILDIHNLRLS